MHFPECGTKPVSFTSVLLTLDPTLSQGPLLALIWRERHNNEVTKNNLWNLSTQEAVNQYWVKTKLEGVARCSLHKITSAMRAAAWLLLGSLLGLRCLRGAYKCRPPVPQGGHKLWVHEGGCSSTPGRTSHGLRAHRGRSFRQKSKDRHTGRQVGRGKYRSREAETQGPRRES